MSKPSLQHGALAHTEQHLINNPKMISVRQFKQEMYVLSPKYALANCLPFILILTSIGSSYSSLWGYYILFSFCILKSSKGCIKSVLEWIYAFLYDPKKILGSYNGMMSSSA